ncbi:MAG: hypothetical protein AB4368_25200 [Xenococcaceae cyanobacterium]
MAKFVRNAGLAPGMKIEVVQNLAGNLLIAVGETRIGVDGGMAIAGCIL